MHTPKHTHKAKLNQSQSSICTHTGTPTHSFLNPNSYTIQLVAPALPSIQSSISPMYLVQYNLPGQSMQLLRCKQRMWQIAFTVYHSIPQFSPFAFPPLNTSIFTLATAVYICLRFKGLWGIQKYVISAAPASQYWYPPEVEATYMQFVDSESEDMYSEFSSHVGHTCTCTFISRLTCRGRREYGRHLHVVECQTVPNSLSHNSHRLFWR